MRGQPTPVSSYQSQARRKSKKSYRKLHLDVLGVFYRPSVLLPESPFFIAQALSFRQKLPMLVFPYAVPGGIDHVHTEGLYHGVRDIAVPLNEPLDDGINGFGHQSHSHNFPSPILQTCSLVTSTFILGPSYLMSAKCAVPSSWMKSQAHRSRMVRVIIGSP